MKQFCLYRDLTQQPKAEDKQRIHDFHGIRIVKEGSHMVIFEQPFSMDRFDFGLDENWIVGALIDSPKLEPYLPRD